MALSSLLNDKSLARFRTKPCERLVAKGHCSFGDRCQYSHASLPRRNPKKYIYSSELCGFSKCVQGDLCQFAHTKEEQLYHPEFYKTKFCEMSTSCREYYCPYAHTSQEKKNKASTLGSGPRQHTKAELLTPGAVPKNADAPRNAGAEEAGPPPPVPVAAPEGWWFVGDQKDLLVSSKGEVVKNFYALGHSITGGYVRRAQILESGGSTFCVARLLSTSRGDATVANQVIKDIRRWIAHCHSSVQMIRRTVATTVVALPADLRCLDVVVKGLGSSSASLQYHWGTTSLLAKWFQQITSDVANLHSTLRISHLSLGPCSVFLDPGTNEMQMGDFLGKVQFQRNAQSGFSTKDDEWAMWYPAEVQKRIAQEGNLVPGSSKKREDAEIMDEYAVDAWQLGVLAFFLLTGEHPFGASNQPTVVCGNITTHRVAHWNLLEDFPLWADLIGRLLSHNPADRLKVSEVLKHPLFWSFEEGSTFAKPLLEQSRESLYPGRRCAWLCHLPCFADFAPANGAQGRDGRDGRVPPTPPAPMLSRICGEALAGKKPKDLVHFLEAMPAIMEGCALRDAFDLGALAGAQIYAATFGGGIAAPPPGLWPPTPWADVVQAVSYPLDRSRFLRHRLANSTWAGAGRGRFGVLRSSPARDVPRKDQKGRCRGP